MTIAPVVCRCGVIRTDASVPCACLCREVAPLFVTVVVPNTVENA